MNLIEREFSDTLSILSDFKESRYIVAFSGGSDSLALLALCSKAVGNKNTVPVYVNHNLRSEHELAEEIALNRHNCEKLGLELIVREIAPDSIVKDSKHVGIEAAARKKRYEILEEERIKNGCDFILTAHHRDDQIETVLMKIISKAPVTGLRGISEKWNNTLRPLLEFSKSELREYTDNLKLECSFDSTNNDNELKRNEVRNEIIPELKSITPDYEERILNIRNYAVARCMSVKPVTDRISMDVFRSYNDAQKSVVLFNMWDSTIGTSMPQKLQERVIRAVESGVNKTVSSNGGTFYSYNGILFLVNNLDSDKFTAYRSDFDFECENTYLPGNLFISKRTDGKSTDLSLNPALFKGKVIVRFPVEGESIKLKEGTKTVNKLLQDMKVPKIFRSRVPVLSDDDGLCVVFGSVYGGKDRICVKLRTPLALCNYYKYICTEGNCLDEKKR